MNTTALRWSFRVALSVLVSLLALTGDAHAQLGTGWTSYAPTKKIHLDDTGGLQTFSWAASRSVCSPTCAEYRYDAATDTETFRVIDNRSNRSEIRLQNEYRTGRRQFQGYVRFDAPLDDESLFQIFGSTSGATQLMIRGHKASGGSLRGGGKTLATGIYGVERRINVIHDQGKSIQIYVNGSLKHQMSDREDVSNYHKYGCYGTLRTGAATVRWRAARSFKDGRAPVAALEAEPEDSSATSGDEPAEDADENAIDEPAEDADENAIDEPAEDAINEPADDDLGGCAAAGNATRGGAALAMLALAISLSARRTRHR